jgi:hypothetical protein
MGHEEDSELDEDDDQDEDGHDEQDRHRHEADEQALVSGTYSD